VEVLLQQPDQWARIVANPDSLMPTAVEELLRYVSPVIHMRRTAMVDTELGGRTIAAGDKVVMFYPSANRDETMWPDADRLTLPGPLIPIWASAVGARTCVLARRSLAWR
jgi:linalool 8-monooxygenase